MSEALEQQRIERLLLAYADGQLANEGQLWIEAQLAERPELRERLSALLAMQAELRVAATQAPIAMELNERSQSSLRQVAAIAPWRGRRRMRMLRRSMAVAACALLVIGMGMLINGPQQAPATRSVAIGNAYAWDGRTPSDSLAKAEETDAGRNEQLEGAQLTPASAPYMAYQAEPSENYGYYVSPKSAAAPAPTAPLTTDQSDVVPRIGQSLSDPASARVVTKKLKTRQRDAEETAEPRSPTATYASTPPAAVATRGRQLAATTPSAAVDGDSAYSYSTASTSSGQAQGLDKDVLRDGKAPNADGGFAGKIVFATGTTTLTTNSGIVTLPPELRARTLEDQRAAGWAGATLAKNNEGKSADGTSAA